ncbi:MAG: polysaccharide deacetylase domain protein [Deltaproteobacteria bacterium]|nr:polysaccharide deacetylase domain protein [Deltaproteobacteria bacterium]
MRKRQIRTTAKNIIYYLAYHSGVTSLLLKALAKTRKSHPCIILLYHRIVDDSSAYLDKGPGMHHHVYDFEKEISYLKKHYQILSIDETVARIKSRRYFEKPTVAITFDDGYRDNFTLDGEEKISIRTKGEKRAACIELASALKSMPDVRCKELLQGIFERLDFHPNEAKTRMMLNWDEVRVMAGNGITFGSHSHTHPILSRMPVAEAKEELLDSKKIIEEQLGQQVKHFAYPNGRIEDFSEELRNYSENIGFESVASVIHGSNNSVNGNQYSLRRITATSPVWLFAAALLRFSVKN